MHMRQVLVRGWPAVLEMARTLPGPPEIVWELVTDWQRQGDWMLEARDFVVTSPERAGVGVTARATVSIGGITVHDEIEVIRWEPGRQLGIEHRGWVKGKAELHLTPLTRGRTYLLWREELQPPLGIVGAVGLSAFRPLMRRVFTRDLRVLEALVTTHLR
jgi:uncharacterized protein YndB with AHSA1/START domain